MVVRYSVSQQDGEMMCPACHAIPVEQVCSLEICLDPVVALNSQAVAVHPSVLYQL